MSGTARRAQRSKNLVNLPYADVLALHFAQKAHARTETKATRSAKRREKKRALYLAQRSAP